MNRLPERERPLQSLDDLYLKCKKCRRLTVEGFLDLEDKQIKGRCTECGNLQEASPQDVHVNICRYCGCKELRSYTANGYLRKQCNACRKHFNVSFYHKVDLREESYIPSDGPPSRVTLARPSWVPAGTKKMEFE